VDKFILNSDVKLFLKNENNKIIKNIKINSQKI